MAEGKFDGLDGFFIRKIRLRFWGRLKTGNSGMRHILIAAMLWATPATANNLTGNSILTSCRSSDEARVGFCYGYYIGLIEGMRWGVTITVIRSGIYDNAKDANTFSESILGYCVDAGGIEHGQMIDVATQYLERNPATRHESARTLAMVAWQEAFPCPK